MENFAAAGEALAAEVSFLFADLVFMIAFKMMLKNEFNFCDKIVITNSKTSKHAHLLVIKRKILQMNILRLPMERPSFPPSAPLLYDGHCYCAFELHGFKA
jgi:hypothetical protein